MRVVIIGTGNVAIATAKLLTQRDVDVVVIEKDRARIEELSDDLDCGFLNGDGSRPEILKEAGPDGTDILICMGESDQANIIASLVGKSLGFRRVVTSIEDDAYAEICQELGLRDTIIPSQTIARYLADMGEGADVLELSALITGDARLFGIEIKNDYNHPTDLKLPGDTRVICFYRGEDKDLHIAQDGVKLKKGDQVVVLTRGKHLKELAESWGRRNMQRAADVAGEPGNDETR